MQLWHIIGSQKSPIPRKLQQQTPHRCSEFHTSPTQNIVARHHPATIRCTAGYQFAAQGSSSVNSKPLRGGKATQPIFAFHLVRLQLLSSPSTHTCLLRN
jgi:hypothetical protein